ncbi:MAG: transposase [Gammaproteobacteria bacterium]|nr:transposase [Gammaproteobacteria bacterium]
MNTIYRDHNAAPPSLDVEHVFRIVKCQFSYRKTRYKGLAKNAAQVFLLMALANPYQTRGQLMALAG